jgi:hypothetical protein
MPDSFCRFPIEEVTMSTVYETTVDTLREVGERLAHEVPSGLGAVRVPALKVPAGVSGALHDWPDDLVDRVTGRGHKTFAPKRLFVAGGVVVAILAVVWFVRRRRSSDAGQRLSVADGTRTAGAA